MWTYEKKLEYPVKIKNPNPAMAKFIISQYGGPDGEIGASLRYLSQRYSMPYRKVAAVATIVHQLTKNMTMEQIKEAGFQEYFVDHTSGVYAQAAAGFPFDALCFASKGDAITDLHEDMAAEQKARTTYDNILRMVDDPDVLDPIRFLRQREIVHYQRFGEALRIVQDNLDSKNFYAINPEFDLR